MKNYHFKGLVPSKTLSLKQCGTTGGAAHRSVEKVQEHPVVEKVDLGCRVTEKVAQHWPKDYKEEID